MRKISLLSISFDDNLFERNSPVLKRQKIYSNFFKQLVIVSLTTRKNLKPIIFENLAIYPTKSKNKFFYFFDALKLINVLSKKYDVELVTTQDPFATGLIGVLAKILFGYKLNIQIHNDFFNNKLFRSESWLNFMQYLLGLFNLLFADSLRVVAKRLKHDHRAFVAPVPVPLDSFWNKPRIKNGFRIVSVGRLVKQKNYELLLEAAKNLVRIFPTLRITVIGEGEERVALKKAISQLGLKKVVKLVGQKSPREIRRIFNSSHLYAQTSNYEGWGMGIIEAAASGLPVVMTDTGCAGEVVNNRATFGLVIPPNNVLELVTAVTTIFIYPKIFRKIILRGQKLLKKRYTSDQLIAQMVSGYEKTTTKN